MYLFRYGALTYLMQTVPGKPASKLNPKAVSFTSEKSLKRARQVAKLLQPFRQCLGSGFPANSNRLYQTAS